MRPRGWSRGFLGGGLSLLQCLLESATRSAERIFYVLKILALASPALNTEEISLASIHEFFQEQNTRTYTFHFEVAGAPQLTRHIYEQHTRRDERSLDLEVTESHLYDAQPRLLPLVW